MRKVSKIERNLEELFKFNTANNITFIIGTIKGYDVIRGGVVFNGTFEDFINLYKKAPSYDDIQRIFGNNITTNIYSVLPTDYFKIKEKMDSCTIRTLDTHIPIIKSSFYDYDFAYSFSMYDLNDGDKWCYKYNTNILDFYDE